MNITDTKINNGFWKERKELNKQIHRKKKYEQESTRVSDA